MMRAEAMVLGLVGLTVAAPSLAHAKGLGTSPPSYQAECLIIEEAARANLLPVDLLTRLIWSESRFQPEVVSPKGARGVAQFMPRTAADRGLSNPFDPEEAIPQAARLLADLDRRFHNTGSAIAAYNAGGKRVSDWLEEAKPLPRETRNFVLAVTGRSPEEWVTNRRTAPTTTQSCLALSDSLAAHPVSHRREGGGFLPSLEHVGELLPAAQQSGHLLPVAAKSGRLLPAGAQSGKMTSIDRGNSISGDFPPYRPGSPRR